MATTYPLLNEAYHEICKDLASPAQWQQFLQSACKNYKCRFDEQALIYAQKPNATAVLEIARWNKGFRRWVNRGADGIAVFDSIHSTRLKYYFDISDTHESEHSTPVPIWALKPHYEDAIIETLEANFGTLSSTIDLPQAIISAAANAATDNLADYLSDLHLITENSLLEEAPDEYINKNFRELLTNSIAYMALARCGYNASDYFDDSDFTAVHDFDTHATMNALGIATSDVGEVTLREIASTVVALEKSEKKQIYTFANASQSRYTVPTPPQVEERKHDNDTNHLQPQRRLQPPEPTTSPTATSEHWQVRQPTQEVSGTAPSRDLDQSVDHGAAATASTGHRETSASDDGRTDREISAGTEHHGRTESERPDGMGGRDEQHSPPSRGSSVERADLQLSQAETSTDSVITLLPELPTVVEQQEIIEQQAEAQAASAFVISQEVIDRILQKGSSFEHSKLRIFAQFEKGLSKKENVAFLKKEYGWGGRNPALRDPNFDEDHDGKGLHITSGYGNPNRAQVDLTWPMVEKRIGELIKLNRYLNAAETEAYPDYIEERKIQSERVQLAAQFRALVQVYNDYQTRIMEPEKCLNTRPLYDAAQQLSVV